MAGGCSKTVHKQTAQLIQHIALFSRHPSNEQKIGITKFKSLCITTIAIKGLLRPKSAITLPLINLTKQTQNVKQKILVYKSTAAIF